MLRILRQTTQGTRKKHNWFCRCEIMRLMTSNLTWYSWIWLTGFAKTQLNSLGFGNQQTHEVSLLLQSRDPTIEAIQKVKMVLQTKLKNLHYVGTRASAGEAEEATSSSGRPREVPLFMSSVASRENRTIRSVTGGNCHEVEIMWVVCGRRGGVKGQQQWKEHQFD